MTENPPATVNLTEKLALFSDHWNPRIGRRAVLLGAAVGVGLLAETAEACTIAQVRRVPFADARCRRHIRTWVDLLDHGPAMSDQAIQAAAQALNGRLDNDIVREVLGDEVPPSPEHPIQFYKRFRLSSGRPDPRPIRISELNRLHQVGNRAVYQFTLDRYSYHPADPEGCNGMFVHDEYYGVDRTAYLATFENNVLQGIKWFDEWPLERAG